MRPLRIVSYNLHSGIGMDGRIDYDRIADVLGKLHPDLSGLQEISRDLPGSPVSDPLRYLGEKLNMRSFFAGTVDPEKDGRIYHYGIGALSSLDAEQLDSPSLPSIPGSESRTAVFLKVQAEPGKYIYFINTHLACEHGDSFDSLRKEQLKALLDRVMEKKYYPAILAGDLNAEPKSPCFEFLRDHWTLVGDLCPTFPSRVPRIKIDYIAFYPKDAFAVKSYEIVPERLATDHRPVVTELLFNSEGLHR